MLKYIIRFRTTDLYKFMDEVYVVNGFIKVVIGIFILLKVDFDLLINLLIKILCLIDKQI